MQVDSIHARSCRNLQQIAAALHGRSLVWHVVPAATRTYETVHEWLRIEVTGWLELWPLLHRDTHQPHCLLTSFSSEMTWSYPKWKVKDTWTGTEGGELQGYIATLVAWPQQATRGLRLRPPCSACREEQHQDTVMLGPAPGILPTTLSNRAPQSPQDLHPRCVDPKVQKIIQHARSLSTSLRNQCWHLNRKENRHVEETTYYAL